MIKFDPAMFELKNDMVDGEKNWWWIKGDKNAWDGPTKNWEQSHSKKYFEHLRQPRQTVITAGANHGVHCRFYAKIFHNVYAFEPNPYAFHCLVLNCPYDNVFAFNCALGEKSEMVSMNGHPERQSGVVRIKAGNGGPVISLAIDMLALESCDLIQLDTEGSEERILRGAKKTIQKFRPMIIAENGKRGNIKDLLLSWNYDYAGQSVSDHIWTPK